MWAAVLGALKKFLPFILKTLLSTIGFEVARNGISINWKRLAFWSLVAPVLAVVGGRCYAVFSDCIEMFNVWSGTQETFSLGLVPRTFTSLLPTSTAAGFKGAVEFCYGLSLLLAVDRVIALSIQVLALRILQKNSERLFSAITAVIHTAIATMRK